MTNLLGAMFDAPLMAVLKRWPDHLHAVDMEQVCKGWERWSFISACGIRGVKLVGASIDEAVVAAPWPPRLRGLPAEQTRCRTCWEATGKMRPRTQWRQRATVDA